MAVKTKIIKQLILTVKIVDPSWVITPSCYTSVDYLRAGFLLGVFQQNKYESDLQSIQPGGLLLEIADTHKCSFIWLLLSRSSKICGSETL